MVDTVSSLAPTLAPIRADAVDEIPILDLGPYLAGEAGAAERLAVDLRHAFEEIGFYFIINHGVPRDLIAATFEAARRVHAMSDEQKLAVKINEYNIGHLPMRGGTTRHSKLNDNNKPNVNEAYFLARDYPDDHPAVLAQKPFRSGNQWPADLPGFREACLTYVDAMEALALKLVPIYALALDLPADHFTAAFADPMYKLRMSHYPSQPVIGENEFGLAPHTDSSFMTLLAPNDLPGLSVRGPGGNWIDVPINPDAYLVNGGDMLRRWTNDRFLATPHRVVNRTGEERYALPFFFDCGAEVEMHCLATCTDADNPPKYDPLTYVDYMTWFRRVNYGPDRNK